jgi:hypothetical protein
MPRALSALSLLLFAALAAPVSANEPAASSPTVVKKVGNAVERGASAAGRGIETGVSAAASGVKRAASAAERGARKAGNAIERTAARLGLPASGASSAK